MNPEENNYQDYGYQSPRNPRPVSNMSIAALILGSLSIVSSCCGLGGIIFGSLGIIIAIMSRGQEPMQTNAKIGLGLSVAGLILGIIMTLGLFIYTFSTSENFYQKNDYYENYPYEYNEYPDDGGYQYIPHGNNLDDLTEQYTSHEL